jgi:L-asparaginase/Glu-tRNA(Gln) amidotransferase subunit D
MRNDAFNNLLDALAVVAEFEMYEVVILNKFQVFRANRSSKVVIRFILQVVLILYAHLTIHH